jgi:hypothetical protein
MAFVWTPDLVAKAHRLFVTQKCGPTGTARRLGCCTPDDVRTLAVAEGWVTRPQALTTERATIRRLYVDDGLTPAAIATQLGGRWTARKVSQVVVVDGLTALLGDEVRRGRKVAQLQANAGGAAAGRAARWAAMGAAERAAHFRQLAERRVRPERPEGAPDYRKPKSKPARTAVAVFESRDVSPDLRAAIDAAVAAGRVTVLPSARAAGISPREEQFWAAGIAGAWRTQKKRAGGQ